MSNGSEHLPEHPMPTALCGIGGCAYLPGHDGRHTWEVHEWCGILCALKVSEVAS